MVSGFSFVFLLPAPLTGIFVVVVPKCRVSSQIGTKKKENEKRSHIFTFCHAGLVNFPLLFAEDYDLKQMNIWPREIATQSV